MAANEIQNSGELATMAMVFLGLLLFGVSYNLLVDYFQKRTQHYTAEFVVGGVFVTVLASAFVIGWDNAQKVLIFFVASGTPMVFGSWIRHARDEAESKRITQKSAQELTK